MNPYRLLFILILRYFGTIPILFGVGGESVVELSDGSFFVVGRGSQGGVFFEFQCYYLPLTYIDGNGNLIWNQSYGNWDWSYDPAVAIEATNGDILVAGVIIHHTGYMWRERHLIFLRFDHQGNCLQNITFQDHQGELIDVLQLNNGTIVLVQRGTFIWINEDGEIQFIRECGSTYIGWDRAIACRAGGFLVVGSDISTYPASFVIMRFGEKGQALWSRKYCGAQQWEGTCLMESDLCGFIIILYIWDLLVVRAVRVDDFGFHLWNTTYRTIPRTRMNGITRSFDGDFLVCGFENGPAYCIRINDGAALIWQRDWGKSSSSEFHNIITCSNGEYLLIGSSNYLWVLRFADQPVNTSLYDAMFIGGILCIIFGVIVLLFLFRWMKKIK